MEWTQVATRAGLESRQSTREGRDGGMLFPSLYRMDCAVAVGRSVVLGALVEARKERDGSDGVPGRAHVPPRWMHEAVDTADSYR